MSEVAGHALKGLAFLLLPFFIGMLVASVQGWRGLFSSPRLAAGWVTLLLFALLLPVSLTRAARAVVGHESPEADRRAWRTAGAALLVAVVASFLVPWRDLAGWLSATLSELTGIPVLGPSGAASP